MTSTGWDELTEFARAHHSAELVVRQHGSVVVDELWELPPSPLFARLPLDGSRSRQDVASVQKSIVSVLVGIAIANGDLSLGDTATQHLGAGWTGRDDVETEANITLEHLLSMTSGLGDAMEFVAAPGERWDYNLVAYPTVKRILTAAVGESLDAITRVWLTEPLGMTDTVWSPRQWDDRFPAALRGAFFYPDGTPMEALVTTARDLATFGHAVMAGCVGLGVDDDYRRRMTTTSQPMNPAYGWLWWLNGGNLWPGVPADAFAAVGAGDQCCVAIPSLGLVVARTGQPADGTDLAGSEFVGRLAAGTVEACRSS